MNWEFLLGLLLPAYGFGYVWLIKTAREDRPLYKLIARKVVQVCVGGIFLVAGLIAWLRLSSQPIDAPLGIEAVPAIFTVIVLVFTAHSIQFFNRIAELPPKEGSTPPAHTPQQSK